MLLSVFKSLHESISFVSFGSLCLSLWSHKVSVCYPGVIDELKICEMSRFYVACDNEDVSSSIKSLHESVFFRIIWLSINGCSLTKSRLNSRFVQLVIGRYGDEDLRMEVFSFVSFGCLLMAAASQNLDLQLMNLRFVQWIYCRSNTTIRTFFPLKDSSCHTFRSKYKRTCHSLYSAVLKGY